MLQAISKERYLLAIFLYCLHNSISAKKICLVEIKSACTSMLCWAQSEAIFQRGYIASPLMAIF